MATYIGNKSYPLMTTKLKNYIYEITLDAMVDNTIIHLNPYIKSMEFYYLYSTTYMPVLRVALSVTYDINKSICTDITKTKFRLNINLIDRKDYDETKKKSNGISQSVLKNEILVVYNPDKNNYQTDFDEMVDSNIRLVLELFSKKHLSITRPTISNIFTKSKIKDCLFSILSKTGMKCLITPPNHTEKVSEIVCPSKNIPKTIAYIQEVFGIYRTGLRLFFDYDRIFCLSGDYKYNTPTVESGEYPNTIIYICKTTMDEYGCYYDSSKKVYYVLAPNSNTFINTENSAREFFGEEVTIKNITKTSKKATSTDVTNKYSTDKNKTSTNLSTSKAKAYYTSSSNEYLSESLLAEVTKKELQFICSLREIDLSYISMNKRTYIYFLDSDNDSNTGLYQISDMIVECLKLTPTLYGTSATLLMNKLNSTFLGSN
jgi:hypothetical protein